MKETTKNWEAKNTMEMVSYKLFHVKLNNEVFLVPKLIKNWTFKYISQLNIGVWTFWTKIQVLIRESSGRTNLDSGKVKKNHQTSVIFDVVDKVTYRTLRTVNGFFKFFIGTNLDNQFLLRSVLTRSENI